VRDQIRRCDRVLGTHGLLAQPRPRTRLQIRHSVHQRLHLGRDKEPGRCLRPAGAGRPRRF
jgi:hypothetical protein